MTTQLHFTPRSGAQAKQIIQHLLQKEKKENPKWKWVNEAFKLNLHAIIPYLHTYYAQSVHYVHHNSYFYRDQMLQWMDIACREEDAKLVRCLGSMVMNTQILVVLDILINEQTPLKVIRAFHEGAKVDMKYFDNEFIIHKACQCNRLDLLSFWFEHYGEAFLPLLRSTFFISVDNCIPFVSWAVRHKVLRNERYSGIIQDLEQLVRLHHIKGVEFILDTLKIRQSHGRYLIQSAIVRRNSAMLQLLLSRFKVNVRANHYALLRLAAVYSFPQGIVHSVSTLKPLSFLDLCMAAWMMLCAVCMFRNEYVQYHAINHTLELSQHEEYSDQIKGPMYFYVFLLVTNGLWLLMQYILYQLTPSSSTIVHVGVVCASTLCVHYLCFWLMKRFKKQEMETINRLFKREEERRKQRLSLF